MIFNFLQKNIINMSSSHLVMSSLTIKNRKKTIFYNTTLKAIEFILNGEIKNGEGIAAFTIFFFF